MSKGSWFTYRREVQAIFQNPFEVYNPFYKVDHVFHFPLRKFKMASSRAEGQRLIEEALEVVGLRPSEILGRYPHQLSGGQRQRLMIARAFMLKPKLIIADEPVSMIDASLQARILDIFERLSRDFGISFLYITHDLSTAYQISHDIYVLYLGQVMERGDIEAVMGQPHHPYTQLLVSSIPTPDPDARWQEPLRLHAHNGIQEGTAGHNGAGMNRCNFYPQCVLAGDCARQVGWAKVGEAHWVACAPPEPIKISPAS
jgi:peptide/nickel transport system ATP-binding protein